MDIACNIDNNYVQHCVVMLTSLFENNKDEKITVYLVSGPLSEENEQVLRNLFRQYKQELRRYHIDQELVNDCPTRESSHLTVSTYYRLFLASILPDTLSKVLYLDCDMIIRGSLCELWDTDVSGYPVACIEDMWCGRPEYYGRMHYDPAYSYFNGGVLVVNLDYWRTHQLQPQFLEYARKYPERLLYCDQDVLNGVLHEHKLLLPFKWNVQDGFFRRKRRIRKETWAELDASIRNPVILHYTGGRKPWHFGSDHPMRKEYNKYLDLTVWKGTRPAFDFWTFLNRWVKSIACFLKLEKPRYRKI